MRPGLSRLLDDATQPVDKDVFLRELAYYQIRSKFEVKLAESGGCNAWTSFYSIVKFFVQGGPFMLPILFVGAVGTAIAIERYVTLTRMSVKNRNVWSQVEPVLASGDFDKARELDRQGRHGHRRLLSWAWRCRARCAAATTSRRRWRRA